MALYTKESRDRVRDAVDFVELVSARTELRRAGPARYEGLCPFHDERTPSFGIDPTQKVYYCFGCQASGDVFTFVQETEGVDFKGALELLAERYGVELEREQEDPRGGAPPEARAAARAAVEDDGLLRAVSVGLDRGEEGAGVPGRARAGGGDPEGVPRRLRAERVGSGAAGLAPQGGFSEQELYATGLAQRSKQNGQLYDRFRSRIMFPLADIRGRVLGFGARALEDDDGEGAAQGPGRRPKYLNTSDNDVYHKGLHLYGADLARAHAAKAGQVILCEGYTDVIALHQAGMRNAVGLMGTALTADQVGAGADGADGAAGAGRRQRRAGGDAAGGGAGGQAQAGAARGAAAGGRRSGGADPARGRGGDRGAVEASVPFVRFRVERVLAAGDDSSAEGRDRMIDELRPVFAHVPPSAMRMELSRMVASRLEVPDSVFEDRIAGRGSSGARRARAGTLRRGRHGTAAPRW